ncbi:MAG: hypothetical protein WDM88_13035 [Galbitalea sp.]
MGQGSLLPSFFFPQGHPGEIELVSQISGSPQQPIGVDAGDGPALRGRRLPSRAGRR